MVCKERAEALVKTIGGWAVWQLFTILLPLFASQAGECSVPCDHCVFLVDEVRPKVLWIHKKLIIVCRVCCGSKNCKSVLFCSIMISFETGLHLKKFPVNNSWFSSDVTKIQTPKSQGLLGFYLHLAKDLLKINVCASFQRDSILRFENTAIFCGRFCTKNVFSIWTNLAKHL